MKYKFINKIIEKLIFRYFNIRNFKIPKYRSFYIWQFQIFCPTRKNHETESEYEKLYHAGQRIQAVIDSVRIVAGIKFVPDWDRIVWKGFEKGQSGEEYRKTLKPHQLLPRKLILQASPRVN